MQKIIMSLLLIPFMATPAMAQVTMDTYLNGNVFRPDERDRITGGVVFDGEGLGGAAITVEATTFANPNTQAVELGVSYPLSDRLSFSVGATVTPESITPSAGVGWLVTESEDLSVYSAYSYGLMNTDPRAIAADLRMHEFYTGFWAGDVSGWGKLTAVSDGNEVYEGGFAIATGQEWLGFTGYARGAAEDSDTYWAPSSFVAAGAEVKVPISKECGIGAQLGASVHEGDVSPAFPIAAQCNFDWGDINLGYAYGAFMSVNTQFKF